MGNLAGEAENGGLKLHFDARLRLEFRGAKVTTDAGLLAVRELDEALGLTEMAGVMIKDRRTGRNIRHQMTGLLRQSVYARLAGYEDVNDQERLFHDPAMRAVVGKKALERNAASSQTVSRFETETLATDDNLAALSAINHAWVSKAMRVTKAKNVVRFYNKRGLCEQHITEGKGALSWTRLSCTRYACNQVRLALFILAYNLGNFLRRLALPREVSHWSLRSVQLKLIKIGARIVSHARRTVFQMAEVAVPGELFAMLLARIRSLAMAPT
jgi:hypothetical protein